MRILVYNFLILFLIVFYSCSSLQTVNSLPKGGEQRMEYRFYDSESKIRYNINNDEESLLIKLNTSHPQTIFRILRNGLTVYFDLKGKSNKSIFLNYPDSRDQEKIDLAFSRFQGAKPNLDLIITELPLDALFTKNDTEELLPISGASTGTSIKLEMVNQTELSYSLSMPFSKITDGGFSDISKLSVGFESGKLIIPGLGDASPGAMRGERAGPRVGGNAVDNMPGGGMQGMDPYGSFQEELNNRAIPDEVIKHWVKVNLFK